MNIICDSEIEFMWSRIYCEQDTENTVRMSGSWIVRINKKNKVLLATMTLFHILTNTDFTHILNLASVDISPCIYPSRAQMAFINPIQILFYE